MTCSQIVHFLGVQGWAARLTLFGRGWSVLKLIIGVFETCSRSADFKVVGAQISLFVLVKFGTQLGRVPLQIELDVGFRQVVSLHIE